MEHLGRVARLGAGEPAHDVHPPALLREPVVRGVDDPPLDLVAEVGEGHQHHREVPAALARRGLEQPVHVLEEQVRRALHRQHPVDLPPQDALPALDAQRLVEGPRHGVVLAVVDHAAVGDIRLVLGDREVVDRGPLGGLDGSHGPPAVCALRRTPAARRPAARCGSGAYRRPERDGRHDPERSLGEQGEVERPAPVVGLRAPGPSVGRAEGVARLVRGQAEHPSGDGASPRAGPVAGRSSGSVGRTWHTSVSRSNSCASIQRGSSVQRSRLRGPAQV